MDSPPNSPNNLDSVSVVIPVCGRVDPIDELHARYRDAVADAVSEFEFIYVLDGPAANIRERIEQLGKDGEKITIVRLGLGAGESTSMMVGVEHAKFDRILFLPPYYQIEPSSITKILTHNSDVDLLVARRWPRKDSTINQFATTAFSKIVRWVSGTYYDDLGCTVRLAKRHLFEEIILYGDQHRFLPMLAEQRGYTIESISVPQDKRDAPARVYGLGVYLRRLLDLIAVFFLVKFTRKPLRFFGLIGVSLSAAGIALLLAALLGNYFFSMQSAFQAAIVAAGVLPVILGAQFLALGLIGELIIFTHARELKEYSVAELVNFEN